MRAGKCYFASLIKPVITAFIQVNAIDKVARPFSWSFCFRCFAADEWLFVKIYFASFYHRSIQLIKLYDRLFSSTVCALLLHFTNGYSCLYFWFVYFKWGHLPVMREGESVVWFLCDVWLLLLALPLPVKPSMLTYALLTIAGVLYTLYNKILNQCVYYWHYLCQSNEFWQVYNLYL